MGRPINKRLFGKGEGSIQPSSWRRSSGTESTEAVYIIRQRSTTEFIISAYDDSWQERMILVDKDADTLAHGEFRIEARIDGMVDEVSKLHGRKLITSDRRVKWNLQRSREVRDDASTTSTIAGIDVHDISATTGGVTDGGGSTSQVLSFAPAAIRILNRNSPGARATVTDYTGSTVTVTEYSGASTINGFTTTGELDEELMPVGWSRGPRQSYIITSPQTSAPPPNRTYAPGNSNMWIFTGQRFEIKTGLSSTAGSLAFRWSEDNGINWEQIYFPGPADAQNWIQIDFGTATTRVVEVICCDQNFTPNGYNLDTGATIPQPFTDTAMPRIMMFGDSYVFGQNADDEGAGLENQNQNDQKAINGMTRKVGEYLGCLQIANHGLRGNRNAGTQSNRSKFADRLTGGTAFPGFGELFVDLDQQGTERDLIIIPSTINDDSASPTSTVGLVHEADARDTFQRIKDNMPNSLFMFPIGARAPQHGESDHWIDNYKNAFRSVFGNTEEEWIANGAWMLDGTRRDGAAWIPAGAEGSNPLFGDGTVNTDAGHPTAAGHDFFGQRYAEGAIELAKRVAIAATAEGFGTDLWDPASLLISGTWVNNGDGSFTKPAGTNSNITLVDSRLVSGEAYVVKLTVDNISGADVRIRFTGGTNTSITTTGEHAFILDDRTTNDRLIIQALGATDVTIRDVSVHRLQ